MHNGPLHRLPRKQHVQKSPFSEKYTLWCFELNFFFWERNEKGDLKIYDIYKFADQKFKNEHLVVQ